MSFGLSFATWEPIYEAILDDFRFDRECDERARDHLGALCGHSPLEPEMLPDVRGNRVWIAGAAESLETEIHRLPPGDFVFGASTATATLQEADIQVDLHVTDLDKDEATTVRRSLRGEPVALHAHGDNQTQLARFVPPMDVRFVLPTTQAAPQGRVVNPGGFTDGDRAAFLAHALGARELRFLGWDFDDPCVSTQKRRKLRWAERLLFWLEKHRSQRFDILDGRRQDIDIDAFPDPTT